MNRSQTYETLIVVALVLGPIIVPFQSRAQKAPYRVLFRDKGMQAFEPGSVLYEKVKSEFHPRALERRSMVGMNPQLNILDCPIDSGYRAAVLAVSDSLLRANPRFNAMVVGLDSAQVETVRAFPFVRDVAECRSISYIMREPENCGPIDENYSTAFLDVGNVNPLHDAGVFGQGARIGLIDNGFRWKAMRALTHANVEAEYDFIYRRPTTANQDNDVAAQDEHGSMIMSVAAAWQTDSVMGVAPLATYLLAKSEDMRYERRIEEDLYVEALWWLEKNGADISSSSLGYRTFDSTDASTPYDLLNGSTTYVARAVNLATQRGMLCVTAAGNEGPFGKTISSPADADSAVTVGALSLDGVTPWMKSSWGPNASGRQKPELVAPGMRVPVQDVTGRVVRPSGTSLATPMVAAQIGLLRHLYPNIHPSFLREAIFRTSTLADQPDSILGYGALNTLRAAQYLGPAIAEPAVVVIGGKTVVLAPIFTRDTILPRLVQTSADGARSREIPGLFISGCWYQFVLDDALFTMGEARIRIFATSAYSTTTAVYPADQASILVRQRGVSVPCGMRLPATLVSVPLDHHDGSEPILASAPLREGTRELVIHNWVRETPERIRIVNAISGQETPCSLHQHDGSTLTVLGHSGLSSGAWILECNTQRAVLHFPFIVQ